MKIKIDKYGQLHLERAGKMQAVECPFMNKVDMNDNVPCGDWCALFENPILEKDNSGGITIMNMTVKLCRKKYTCSAKDFTDERGEANNGK